MASITADGQTTKAKLHGRAFYESIGSPRYVLAPMVDQSEFAWRMLSRSFLSPAENAKLIAYTPMFHARLYEETAKYRESHFEATRLSSSTSNGSASSPAPSNTEAHSTPIPFLDGNPTFDRPLSVQFCANDPEHLLGAAKLVAPYCDAVDLNLGCPQGIARKGHYGAFLQEDQELIYSLINILHKNLPIPVTAKIRILDTKENTLAYAKNVLAAGASIITVHGRRREQKGHITGVADWQYIRYLRDNLPKDTVIFANGNILQHDDIERCLEATGADAVMSAEGNLSDPAIFAKPLPLGQEGREYWRGKDGKGGYRIDAVFRRYMDIIHKYALEHEPPARKPLFAIGDDESWLTDSNGKDTEQEEEGPARKKRKKDGGGGGKNEKCTSPNLVAIRPHLFHLLRHFISKHTDVRDALARCRAGDIPAIEKVLDMVERRVAEGLVEYERTRGKSVEESESEPKSEPKPTAEEDNSRVEESAKVEDADDTESSVVTVKKCKRPWWIAQPIVRPLPKEALANGSIRLSKKEIKKQEKNLKADIVEGNNRSNENETVEGELPKTDTTTGIKEPTMDTKRPTATTDELIAG